MKKAKIENPLYKKAAQIYAKQLQTYKQFGNTLRKTTGKIKQFRSELLLKAPLSKKYKTCTLNLFQTCTLNLYQYI